MKYPTYWDLVVVHAGACNEVCGAHCLDPENAQLSFEFRGNALCDQPEKSDFGGD